MSEAKANDISGVVPDKDPRKTKNLFIIKGMERVDSNLLFTIRLANSGEILTQSYLEWVEFAKFNSDKLEYRDLGKALDEFMDFQKNPPKLMAELAKGKVEEFFHDQHRIAFAIIDSGNHREIRPVKSIWFKDWLRELLEKATGKLAGPDAVNTAVEHLASQGRKGTERKLYVRVAWGKKNEDVYIDMANDRWQAIHVTKDGWKVVDRPPILFRRPDGILPLVVPAESGNIDKFMDCLNKVGITQSQMLLYKVRLISNYIPLIAKAILVMAGDQGGGKTKYVEAEKSLLDPADWNEHKPPTDTDQLTRDFANNLIVWYGNISKLDEDQQDWMCTGCTGGGFRKRQLYTDDDELYRTFKVAIGLNGINNVGSNPDFLDRIILLLVKAIPGTKLLGDDEWLEKMEASRPAALGYVLDILSKALAKYPSINLKARFRLAAFCKWGEAISQAMGKKPDEFMEAYGRNRQMVSRTAITLNPVGQAILDYIDTTNGNFFVGTATDLLKVLNDYRDNDNIKRDTEWPSNPTKLSEQLNIIRLDLERAGIEVKNDKNFDVRKAREQYPDHKSRLEKKSDRTRVIVIQKVKPKEGTEGLWNAKYEEMEDKDAEGQT